jgi:hypothetical protein
MKRFKALFLTLVVSVLLVCGCVTFPTTPTTPPSIWPQQSTDEALYYVPQKMSSVDEAIGTIKNLQQNFVEWRAGMNFSSLEVDPFGIRAKWAWTETSQQTAYVPSYGGMWVGGRYIPTYSGTYQTQTSTQEKNDMFIIPFNEIKDLDLWHMPNINNLFKWGLVVRLENDKEVQLRVSDESYVFKLANAMATIAMERGVKFPVRLFGCYSTNLTPQQSGNLRLPPNTGQLVVKVIKNSPAEKSGVQFLDVLLECDKVPLKSAEDLGRALKNAHDARKKVVSIRIIRREKISQPVIDPKTQKVLRTEVIEQKVEKVIDFNFQ